MKIEKLTENKIRIILKYEDFKSKNINMKELLFTTPECQSLLLEILNKAKKEIDFDTEGYKLLIEVFSENNDFFIFTITKYTENTNNFKNNSKKFLTVKRKKQVLNSTCYTYNFADFEDFCNLCNFLNRNNNIDLNNLFKSSILYLYNDTYYLVIDNINLSNKSLNYFHSSLLEFSSFLSFTKNFKFKLKEHGKIIIKNNAISTGIKYFAYK